MSAKNISHFTVRIYRAHSPKILPYFSYTNEGKNRSKNIISILYYSITLLNLLIIYKTIYNIYLDF